MYSASQAMVKTHGTYEPLPHCAELKSLYDIGWRPMKGEFIMIAGRPASYKSSFALWWVLNMGLRTLYFSADMSDKEASLRLASCIEGVDVNTVQARIDAGGDDARRILDRLDASGVSFSFGSPIRWSDLEAEIGAWVEIWDEFPEVLVVDNLMDCEESESGYEAQMATMQSLHDMCRETGMTVIVLHHATDKTMGDWSHYPPGRDEIKNKLGEKPQQTLTVAINTQDNELNVAIVKQRMGPCWPKADKYVALDLHADTCSFKHKPYSERHKQFQANAARKLRTVSV